MGFAPVCEEDPDDNQNTFILSTGQIAAFPLRLARYRVQSVRRRAGGGASSLTAPQDASPALADLPSHEEG